MLTCTGKTGEVIVVDDNFCITLAGIRDNEVLLSFDCVKKIAVHRKELSKNSIPVFLNKENTSPF